MENKKINKNIIKIDEENIKLNKFLLDCEWVIGYTSIALFLTLLLVAILVPMAWYFILALVTLSIVSLFVEMYFCLKIEQIAGYYECKKCGHRHKPKFSSILWSAHFGRTRYLHCNECNKLTWQQKVIK